MQTGADFDSTGCYRYSLWRSWDEEAARVGFVMLNPSRADTVVNDPTIRRCIGFARSWGYGSLEVVNLFAYRTSYPTDLRCVTDPVGVENDRYLASLGQRVNQIILAWGNWGKLQERDRAVLSLLSDQKPVFCLGVTKLGQPKHPLYLSGKVLPSLWFPAFTQNSKLSSVAARKAFGIQETRSESEGLSATQDFKLLPIE